jgi:hypothetical protein
MPEGDTTTFINGNLPAKDDSHIFGISIRGWIALTLVITVCASHLLVSISVIIVTIRKGDWSMLGTLTTIGEPLYSMSVAALGFYFGQLKSKS